MLIGLSDRRLATVMDAARVLPIEKRSLFLERIAAALTLRGRHVSDSDVASAVQRALQGLVHHQPA
jgi:hypothetical protein